MKFEAEKLIREINDCTDINKLNVIMEQLKKAITEQQEKIESLQGEIIVIRYNDYNKSIMVEKGNNIEFAIHGFLLTEIEVLEIVPCPRTGTKKFTNLVNELKEKYNAVLVESVSRKLIA